MKSQITRLVGSCFGILWQIRSIRRSLPRESILTLISSYVMSKLDYCNVAYAGLPRCQLDRLQSVMNAAARLTVGAQLHDHITLLLADLHWLQIPQRIQHTLCVLRTWDRVVIPTRGHLSGQEHRVTTSPSLCLLGRLDRAGYATFHTGRSCFRRGRSACLEHFARCDPSVLITWNFQTLIENSFRYSELFLMPSFWLVVSLWHCKVSLKYFYLFTAIRQFKLNIFTLHYISWQYQQKTQSRIDSVRYKSLNGSDTTARQMYICT